MTNENDSPLLTNRFRDALVFAAKAHEKQTRKGTAIPYVSHLLAVASLVIEYGGSEDAAIAALLHDAPEDQGGLPMLHKIRTTFGERVAAIVESCTDTFEKKKPDWQPRKRAYIAHLAAKDDAEACLVSAADKLHNARAILRDVRIADDRAAFWTRFTATERQIGWYYGSLERVLRRQLRAHASGDIVEELARVLDGIAGTPCEEFGEGLRVRRRE
ncbi:MAG: HD domain-containing protein [Burkholderiales bacterium]